MLINRSFSLKNLLFVLGVAVIATFLAGYQVVNAASSDCPDITGQTTPVLKGGVANSGVVYFDLPNAPPAFDDEACVKDTSANPPLVQPGDGPFSVKGWAWDDNLGWVSFYCGDEDDNIFTPYTNMGISCGLIEYSVQMEGLAGANPGRFSEYAWGDNTGWISFNCADGGTCGAVDYYVEAETTDPLCTGEVYSNVPACTTTPVRPPQSVFAFSDNVGWIDFTGVKFPWVQLTAIAVDVDFEILSDATDLLSVDKTTAPIADNTDEYEMILQMTKSIDGTPLDDPTDFTITVDATWADSVDLNQIDISNADHSLLNDGATVKPFAFSDFGSYAGYSGDVFTATVSSYAPTSSMNPYEGFILGGPAFAVPSNDLVLSDVKVSVLHNDTGLCSYGGPLCVPQSVALIKGYAGAEMPFVPAVEVSVFDDAKYGDAIAATRTVPNTIEYQVDCRGKYTGLCPASSVSVDLGIDSPFVFVKDEGLECLAPQFFNLDLLGTTFNVTPFLEQVSGECPTVGPDTGEDPHLYTTVQYTNLFKPVKYFSNKLPRVEGTLVTIPVAEIVGNVYSTGVTNPVTGQEIRSLGDVSTNILRDTLNRNVENIIAGADEPGGTAKIIDWDGVNDKFIFSAPSYYVGLLPDVAGAPRAYYFDGDVLIDGAIDWEGERTIIIKGGDLYVNENIYTNNLFAKMGVIVLKEFQNDGTTVGGNLFLGPNVTNVQLVAYLDGSLMSYDPIYGVDPTTKEPIWPSEAVRFASSKNQALWEGKLASMNTIGGAVATPAVFGDGSEALVAGEGTYGPPATGRSKARLYDLNFLRYYGYVYERHDSGPCIGDAVEQDDDSLCPGDPGYNIEAIPVTEGGDLVLLSVADPSVLPAIGLGADDASAVYFKFDPETATLPGFAVPGGVDYIIRP